MNLKTIDIISLILTIVGGLNWGLVGFFKFNLVTSILGDGVLASVVYMLVGLASVYVAVIYTKLERKQ